jgi:HTH-type transcriptional regulator/antitoxin HipB
MARMETFGLQLRAARQAQRLSIRQAAQRLGCSPRFVHELEHGKPTARLDKVRQAAAGLGLRLTLTGGAEPPADASSARSEARARQRLREERLARAHDRIAARLALGEIRADAIARARAQVAKWQAQRICSKWYVQRWTAILRGPARSIAARLLALEPADARALFQNTPFGFLVRAELEA